MNSVQIIPVQTLTLELVSQPAAVAEACWHARQFLETAGLAELALDHWELVLTEAGNNAIQHAPGPCRNRPVRFEIRVSPDTVEVCILDHTDGFDFPSAAALPPVDSEKGRGLFLIQNLTDSAQYIRGRTENCLILRKGRGDSSAGPNLLADAATARQSETVQLQHTLDLMTEEVASCYESLSAIFRFSGELGDQTRPEAFADKWLEDLTRTVRADWYCLRLLSEDSQALRLTAVSGWPSAPETLLLGSTVSEHLFVEIRAATSGADVWFDGGRFSGPSDSGPLLSGPGSGFAHPIIVNDKLLGVLTIGRNTSGTPFQAAQVNVIQVFADFLGLQLRNAQLHETQTRSRLMNRELQIAAEIQRSFLPRVLPTSPGLELVSHFRSASHVGGDFYDAFPAGDGLLLAIADAMGKGVPAAMFVAVLRAHLRAGVQYASSPGEFLTWLNQTLFEDLDRVEMFITARLVYVDLRKRCLLTASAAHPPLLVADPDGVQESKQGGLPIGIARGTVYQEESLPLPARGLLLLLTDGLTEAEDPLGQFLGYTPLKEVLQEALGDHRMPRQTAAALAARVDRHRGGVPARDDEAFLLLATCPDHSISH